MTISPSPFDHLSKKQHLKNETIYQVFVRNYSPEGTFKALERDLPRIADLGVSTLYLLPIHPLGITARKGSLGSPYSITDYYAINPELGTLEDFTSLVDAAHRNGLKVMMDIVFNHTARDAKWVTERPDFYFYRDGALANRVGDWSDIADLLVSEREVQDSLIDVLLYWIKRGVDGFRCDVAPMLPISFWIRARADVDAIRPDAVWLSESVDPVFLRDLREAGFPTHSDAEMYLAFDALYDYDIFDTLEGYFSGKNGLSTYLTLAHAQGHIYPDNYIKAHYLENHDRRRAASYAQDRSVLKNLTAWSFFQNGLGFLYAGQETLNTKTPSLFEKDLIDLEVKDREFYDFIKGLIALKKSPAFSTVRRFDVIEAEQPDLIQARMNSAVGHFYGVFNLSGGKREVAVPFEDGTYKNLFDHTLITIVHGVLVIDGPVMVEAKARR
jgi:glycosidase